MTSLTAPTRVVIPRVAVSAVVIRLGLNADGTLQVPERFDQAGWYDLGPSPGQPGAAVIVGHLDSAKGPGVFASLARLRPGDTVQVIHANYSLTSFVVDRLQEVSKTVFPLRQVYGPTREPELRLITCTGSFDWRTRHYRDNLIVYARAP